MQGAFNNTDPKRLVKIMEARHLPSYLSNWTASFTAKRIMAFCFENNIEAPQPYDSGLPQGSPGSPVLFLIYAQARPPRLYPRPPGPKPRPRLYPRPPGLRPRPRPRTHT